MIYQDKLFPDFTPEDLYAAVEEYARRDRRWGHKIAEAILWIYGYFVDIRLFRGC